MVDITSDEVWKAIAQRELHGHRHGLGASGEARTAGVMHHVDDGRLWFTTQRPRVEGAPHRGQPGGVGHRADRRSDCRSCRGSRCPRRRSPSRATPRSMPAADLPDDAKRRAAARARGHRRRRARCAHRDRRAPDERLRDLRRRRLAARDARHRAGTWSGALRARAAEPGSCPSPSPARARLSRSRRGPHRALVPSADRGGVRRIRAASEHAGRRPLRAGGGGPVLDDPLADRPVEERAEALKERVYATFTGLAIVLVQHANVAARRARTRAAVDPRSSASSRSPPPGFVADVIAHLAVHAAFPDRAGFGRMLRTAGISDRLGGGAAHPARARRVRRRSSSKERCAPRRSCTS